jgi:localization factor PodJL
MGDVTNVVGADSLVTGRVLAVSHRLFPFGRDMNKAAPWSIKGVDFDARDAAKEAARRAGMSLGEWLNDVISEQARDLGVNFEDVDEEGRLEAVTARLASMSGKGNRSLRRNDPSDDFDAPRRRSAPQRPRAQIRETQYSRPSRGRDNIGEPEHESFGNAEALLDAAIRAYERGASRGEQATAEISKVSRRLENIEHRLTSSYDEPEVRGGDKYARLEARLEALTRDKESEKSERSIRGLERRLEEMAERIDAGRAQPVPQPVQVERDSDVVRIESKLNRLIDTLDAPRRALEPPVANPDVLRLESKLNRLIDTLDTPAPRRAMEPARYAPAPEYIPAPAATRDRAPSPAAKPLKPAGPDAVGDAIAQITRRQRDLDANPRGRAPLAPQSSVARAPAVWSPAPQTAPVQSDPALQALRADVAALTRQIEDNHRAFAERDADRREAPERPDPAVANLKIEIAALHRRLEETQREVVARIDEQSRVAERHAVPAQPDPALAALRNEISQLNRQLEEGQRAVVARIDEQSRAGLAPAKPDPSIAALKSELVGLNRRLEEGQRAVVARIDEQARVERPPSPEMDSLRQRIDEMSRSLTTLAPRDAVASLDGAIRSLGQRVEESLRDHSKENLLRPIADLAGDLKRGLAEVASQNGVESVERAIRDLGEKIEHGAKGAVDARAVAEIHAQTKDIRDLLQKAITRPAPTETIERQIAKLTDRLDLVSQAGLDDATRARLIAELPPVVDTAPSGMIELLAKRIDDLGRKIDDAVSQAGASDQLDELARRIDDVHASLAARGEAVVSQVDTSALEKMMRDIAGKLERPSLSASAPVAALDTSHIEDMLRTMGARFEDAPRGVEARVVEELRDEVSRLTKVVESNGRSGGELSALEDIRRDMARLFELAESPPPEATDNGAIAELRDQFGALANRLDRVDDGARALGSLENAIGELAHRIDDARTFAADAAEAAARNAAQVTISEALARLPLASTPAGLSEEVTRDLADLRSNQESIDRRTYSTLTAVHETLEKVVDRIAILEEEIGDPRSGSMLAVGDAPVFAPAAPSLAAVAPKIPSVSINASETSAPSPFAAGAFDELLEPGANPPRMSNGARPIQIAPSEPNSNASKPSEANKLIEAARRAAQANAAAAPQVSATRDGKAARAREKSTVDQAQADVIARARAAEKVWPGLAGRGDQDGVAASGGLSRVKSFFSARRLPVVLVGVIAVAAVSGWQVMGRHSGPPIAEVIDMTSGGSPSRAPDANDAPAKSVDPAKRDGASLERPIGQSSFTSPTDSKPGSQAANRSMTDPAPVGTIGSGAFIGAPAMPTTRGGTLQSAAASGDASAQYELGARYADGRSGPRDPKQAVDWFTKAAHQNLAPAQYRLGSMYERGLTGERDPAKARDWYKKAADAGNVRAMHNMAVLSAEGSDGKPDYPMAASWFRQAAEYGVRDSQYNLAILYARGLGIDQNLVQSWAWFAIAAAQGDTDAAKKQEDVGARLDSKQLEQARTIVAAFRPRTPAKAANEVAEPVGGWDAAGKADAKRDFGPVPAVKPAMPKGKVTSL